MQNDHSDLINFVVKASSSETFNMNSMLDVQFFFYVVNIVSREVLEHYVGCCNHGAMGVFKHHAEET